MKKLIIAVSVLLVSCEEPPMYKYATGNYIPDSMMQKRQAWIVDAIEAACAGTAGDGQYEDAIYYAVNQSESIFEVRGEGLEILKGKARYEFVPKERLTSEELSAFNSLRPKQK